MGGWVGWPKATRKPRSDGDLAKIGIRGRWSKNPFFGEFDLRKTSQIGLGVSRHVQRDILGILYHMGICGWVRVGTYTVYGWVPGPGLWVPEIRPPPPGGA